MKTFICIAAGLLAAAFLGGEARALTSSQAVARPAVERAANAAPEPVKVRHRRHSGLFSNYCAYNCYRVPRCHGCPLGKYGYSRFAYDEDVPFRCRPYRWDWEANPIDNADAFVYRYTGQPVMRAFERIY